MEQNYDIDINQMEDNDKRHGKRGTQRCDFMNEEESLEQILFGRESDIIQNFSKRRKVSEEEEESEAESSDESEYDFGKVLAQTEKDFEKELQEDDVKKSVWHDDDDDINVAEGMSGVRKLPKKVVPQQKYKEYLEAKFCSLYKGPKWAQIDDKKKQHHDDNDCDDDENDDELIRTAGDFISKSQKLEKGVLQIKKCTDLTSDLNIKRPVNCVEFHPTSTVALIASTNGFVNLFQVDGKINSKIQTVQFRRFAIDSAHFANNGEQLIVGSQRDPGVFFYYDMISGKIIKIPFIKGKEKFPLSKFILSNDGKYMASRGNKGFIHVLTTKTKEYVFDFKMNGDVNSMIFSPDSNLLFSHGSQGKAYVWDVRNSRQCVNRFDDDGCVLGTSIGVSPNRQYCVTGSDMGVVNVYNYNDVISQSAPKPLKSIMNLTTEVTTVKFNHSSEILFISSSVKDNSIKCIHAASLTAFSNFPITGKNYKRIYDMDVSVNSGYMAFGTNLGTAFLFRLHHFSNY